MDIPDSKVIPVTSAQNDYQQTPESLQIRYFFTYLFLRWILPISCIVAFALFIALLVYQKSGRDYKIALEDYQNRSYTEAKIAADEVKDAMIQIYQQIRTLSFLPGVRKIDRYGTNMSADAFQSVQQIYRNLRDNVEVSEVYIVPVDLEPDTIDPGTGDYQEPIIMFDGLIMNHSAVSEPSEPVSSSSSPEEKPVEVEIFEYRALRDQMTWLKQHYPVHDNPGNLNIPFLSSKHLITCDNTNFQTTLNNPDRTGVILSVPFFDTDEKLKGTISAIILDSAMRKMLPEQDYALIYLGSQNIFTSIKPGQQTLSSSWVEQAKPDPNLLFSKIIPLDISGIKDQWVVWVGLPDSKFLTSRPVQAINIFRYTGYGLALFILIFGIVMWIILQRSFSLIRGRNIELAERLKLEKSTHEALLAKEAAEKANISKSQFLSGISHELRTPLHTIIGFASIIKNEEAGPIGKEIYREYGAFIHTSGLHLLKMINNILEYSKMDQLEIKIIDVDVNKIIQSCLHIIAEEVSVAQLTLETRLPAEHAVAQSDPKCLKQIIMNLLSNSIKFTPKGGSISITTQIYVKQKKLSLQIKDNGIGIAEQDIAKALSVFEQVDGTLNRKYEGTGLGLPMAKKLTELVGGDFYIESEPGRGTTVTLLLPYVKY